MICRAELPNLGESMRSGQNDLCGQMIFSPLRPPLFFFNVVLRFKNGSRSSFMLSTVGQFESTSRSKIPRGDYVTALTSRRVATVEPVSSLRPRHGTQRKLSRLKKTKNVFHADKWGERGGAKKIKSNLIQVMK